MRLLLDSHVVLWWFEGGARLTGAVAEAIANPDNDIFYSAASAWEFSIKVAAGKLKADLERVEALRQENDFLELPMTVAHAHIAGSLPMHHGDPFDRMLVAQAMTEQLILVTHDKRMGVYGVEILWT